MGCPLKKNWSEFERKLAEEVFEDTDVLYYFSLTDAYLLDQLKMLPPATCGRFAPLMCGFKPTDRTCNEQIKHMIENHPEVAWRGIGKIYARCSEITNLTTGATTHPAHPAFYKMMSEASKYNLPVLLQHNACSESTKPYKYGFEYIAELEETLQKYPDVKVLWVDAGIYVRGQWKGFKDELDRMLGENPNLFITVTAEVLQLQKISHPDLLALAEKHSGQVMVGSSCMGVFTKADTYKKQWKLISEWVGALSKDAQKKVKFDNAWAFFSVKKRKETDFAISAQGEFANGLMHSGTEAIVRTKSDKLHNQAEAKKKDQIPPSENRRMLKGMKDGVLLPDNPEIKHVTIDVHLHMLDFLHKSSGTRSIMEAMDGCGVEKAVLIGMPCVKKWSSSEPEQPLYYQDDNGQCYVYAYSDQMIADAWLALDDKQRARFAPVMSAFNPTDINGISHVQRMWDKYPGMWRGLGEIMCRHDDLTALLQDDESPVINHMAMRPIYEFCIEKDLNCMVHHNADRTAKENASGVHEYVWEVKEVLDAFPDLKLIWAHAGVSRRTHQPTHAEMICELVATYPNLHIDMSWVVWEEVVCDPQTGKPKQAWIDAFSTHPTRFSIGSDQVGQFISPAGANILRGEIEKYWALADVLSAETAAMILRGNAQRIWFDGWDMPSSDKGDRWVRIPPTMKAETLFHNQGYFDWVNEEMY
eukprot:TRINITY_DN21923_c0_g1_i2.p1 TRINITY_DN21923_c0_g1~~TRINITY_DN21923_c0_g1_i2.p1  ORF type:complete len:822 (-),score=171.45 TRINITY_DN21923_c0_g1_i2:68-2167(-)